MRRRYKVLSVISILVAAGLVALPLILNHDSPCPPSPPLPHDTKLMRAVVHRCYGSPEVLKIENVAAPTAADNQVLIKVYAASVNPLDYHGMRGTPTVMRLAGSGVGAPNDPRLGVDFAGTVEAVGKNVTRFKPGDQVFGGRDGALAEYVTVREDRALALKPTNMTFEQAAAVPVAAVTALQALRDKGRLQPGQKVLINGASGGVGTFAVQIAKSLGAEVTGVCSTRNVDIVQSIGADHVIDYTREDFTQGAQRYDLIVDNVGNHSLFAYRRVLNPKGTLVIVGGTSLAGPLTALLLSPLVSQRVVMVLAQLNQRDLILLRDLMRAGKMTPVIDRRYGLSEVAAAVGYLEAGHARGKVIISVE
jgi:NADPH:quinone reductase-like Zn-dependent oxidoreductase